SEVTEPTDVRHEGDVVPIDGCAGSAPSDRVPNRRWRFSFREESVGSALLLSRAEVGKAMPSVFKTLTTREFWNEFAGCLPMSAVLFAYRVDLDGRTWTGIIRP